MGKYYKKVKPYTMASIKLAVDELLEGKELRKTARKYHRPMSHFLLSERFKLFKNKGTVIPTEDGRGKKRALSLNVENKIAIAVKEMERMGLGPSIEKLRKIVQVYLKGNNIPNKFKDSMPGHEWIRYFLRRNNFALKKSGMMQLARKNVTSDPFVIFGFYDLLKSEMMRLGIFNRPECIWNADESGFPHDPSKQKTIGSKGVKTVRLTPGAGRLNTTVLATICANGLNLDPLIVFNGVRMQNSWVGNPGQTLPNVQYAVSAKGWMTSDVFHTYFSKFCQDTKGIRPILLIVDGHLSHFSIDTLLLGKDENVHIMKLPAHCTDLLQPLDVSCFGPLKSYYDKRLMEHVHSTYASVALTKQGFVHLLCSVWNDGLSETQSTTLKKVFQQLAFTLLIQVNIILIA